MLEKSAFKELAGKRMAFISDVLCEPESVSNTPSYAEKATVLIKKLIADKRAGLEDLCWEAYSKSIEAKGEVLIDVEHLVTNNDGVKAVKVIVDCVLDDKMFSKALSQGVYSGDALLFGDTFYIHEVGNA